MVNGEYKDSLPLEKEINLRKEISEAEVKDGMLI